MTDIPFGVLDATVSSIHDDTYYAHLVRLINGATRFCFCSMFIVDADPPHDSNRLVSSVLIALQVARWRGVDVRLLIAGSRTNLDIAMSTKATFDLALTLGITSRWLSSTDVKGSHSKYVIVDDAVLLGSHNWSHEAFTGQIQDTVLIHSTALAAFFIAEFETQWLRSAHRGS